MDINNYDSFYSEFKDISPPKGFNLTNYNKDSFELKLPFDSNQQEFNIDISSGLIQDEAILPPSTYKDEDHKIQNLLDNMYNKIQNMKDTMKENTVENKEIKQSEKMDHSFNDKKEFVNTMYNAYAQSLQEKGLDPNYALTLVAQDAIETNYGKSVLGNFNYGNITTTGNDWHKQTGSRKWKDFGSLKDYVDYKIKFLGNKRYQYFQTFSADSNVATSMQVLANRGYDPGNPNYGKIVERVYNDLKKYLS